jgi:hypothetical protein
MQFRLKSLMAIVAALAIVFSVPAVTIKFTALYISVLAALIILPTSITPREHRPAAAYWALALHPLALLLWLSAWRLHGHQVPLYPKDKNLYNTLILDTPYALAFLSRFYLPLAGTLGRAVAEFYLRRRSWAKPLLLLPVVWAATILVLCWDPFKLRAWFWD